MLYVLIALMILMFAYYTGEYLVHRMRRDMIPLRIHVSGTRGKSSVARLIGAGLRASGTRTIVKTTGTAARLILEDASEQPIVRLGPPRIIEQLGIFRVAGGRHADAVVLECMALQPYLHYLSERWIVRANIAVITNIRPDHLDLMGPDVDDVALALSGVLPTDGVLIIRHCPYDEFFQRACSKQRCRLRIVSDEEVRRISLADLDRFSYVEHAENVAVALAVCEVAGIDRETAMEGMFTVQPDPGALAIYHGRRPCARWTFADAFAANDVESNARVWNLVVQRCPKIHKLIVVVNCREDRIVRSAEMGRIMANSLPADLYLLVGCETYVAMRSALRAGLDSNKIVNMGRMPAKRVFKYLKSHLVRGHTLIVGMGNIKGVGEELSAMFREVNFSYG